MFDPAYNEHQAKVEYDKYIKDPAAWMASAKKREKVMWAFLSVFYVISITFLLITSFPSVEKINDFLKHNPRVLFWIPIGCALVGLLLFFIKSKWPAIFGATELAVAFASMHNLKNHVQSEGIEAWAIGFGLIYLFAKGFENLHKGLKVFLDRDPKIPMISTNATAKS